MYDSRRRLHSERYNGRVVRFREGTANYCVGEIFYASPNSRKITVSTFIFIYGFRNTRIAVPDMFGMALNAYARYTEGLRARSR